MDAEKIQQLIELFGLQPLPEEGGLFAETYWAEDWLAAGTLPARYTEAHRTGTAIYYALTADPDSFSAFHSLRSDEIYHFYLGDPVEVVLLLPDGASRQVVLGADVLNGEQVQFVVPAGAWQALHLLPGGRFALMGTTMTPGYAQSDFTLGERVALQAGWPAEADKITRLTRI